jgi:hypothetical protein
MALRITGENSSIAKSLRKLGDAIINPHKIALRRAVGKNHSETQLRSNPSMRQMRKTRHRRKRRRMFFKMKKSRRERMKKKTLIIILTPCPSIL